MGLFDSDGGSAVPGGNVAKPLMIALLALLASRYFGGKGSGETAPQPAPSSPEPLPTSNPSPGDILGGLGGLIKQFQQKGLGDAVDSWVNTGTNKSVSPGDVDVALGTDVVDQLARRTGLSRQQVIDELAKILPNAVDRLTPSGRLPTQAELQRLME